MGITFEGKAQGSEKPSIWGTSHFKTSSQAQSLRWVEEANPRNRGPALKEWSLSLAKK